jgi:BMFP domain-containing protein YqiC
MESPKPLFEDFTRLASGAFGALAGVKEEIEALFRSQFERWTHSLDLVTREEFEAVRAMAAKAREEQEVMAERIAALEAKLGMTQPPEE